MFTFLGCCLIATLLYYRTELVMWLSTQLRSQSLLFDTRLFTAPVEGAVYVDTVDRTYAIQSPYQDRWKIEGTAAIVTSTLTSGKDFTLVSVKATIKLLTMPLKTPDFETPAFTALLVTNHGIVTTLFPILDWRARTLELYFTLQLPANATTFTGAVQL